MGSPGGSGGGGGGGGKAVAAAGAAARSTVDLDSPTPRADLSIYDVPQSYAGSLGLPGGQLADPQGLDWGGGEPEAGAGLRTSVANPLTVSQSEILDEQVGARETAAFFQQNRGGLHASEIFGPGTYYMGVIDMLQEWDWRKRGERLFKTTAKGKDGDGISAIKPAAYRQVRGGRRRPRLADGMSSRCGSMPRCGAK